MSSVIATDLELSRRLFEVLANLTEEEKAAWRESLIAWAKSAEEKA